MNTLRPLFVTGALLLAMLVLGGNTQPQCVPVEPEEPVGCLYDGAMYDPGESFPSDDGCNTCTCMDGGGVACTEMACGCMYEGDLYAVGASFPAADGCNTCACMSGGQVACTLMACGCSYGGAFYAVGDSFWADDACNQCTCAPDGVGCTKVYCPCTGDEWFRDYMGDSADECALIDFICPPDTTYFMNDCGCGCQQSNDCPEWFNCMPPSPCDVDQIEAECPYSGIAW